MEIKRKALLIGINYLGTKNSLRGCINDVINMRSFLMENYGFKKEEIVLLTEASDKKAPTYNNIINYMKWLVQDNNEHSRLFLHYSGHGSYIRDTNGDEADNNDEVICPLDMDKNGVIPDDLLKEILVNPLKKGAKLTCIFDSCHSGSVLDLKYTYHISNNAQLNKIDNDAHYKDSIGDVILISGCLDKQTSADTFEAGMNQGALTYCFLETIKKLRTNGTIPSIENIIKNLVYFIGNRGYSQIPQLSSGKIVNIHELFTII